MEEAGGGLLSAEEMIRDYETETSYRRKKRLPREELCLLNASTGRVLRRVVNAETCTVTSDDEFFTTEDRYRIAFYKLGSKEESLW